MPSNSLFQTEKRTIELLSDPIQSARSYHRVWISVVTAIAMPLYCLSFTARDLHAGESVSPGRSKSHLYNFDVSFSLIDVNKILPGGPPKDGIPALVKPDTVSLQKTDFIEPTDRVVAVSIGGESRVYPLKILIWHEAINDTLNGIPIVVTYCPLCDSALVFHRESGGKVREFGISGLLYQSNVLLYDRQSNPREESLWSQLAMRAVTGPTAEQGLRLELIDSSLTTFHTRSSLHPESTIISDRTGYNRPYRQQAYTDYFATDQLMFPVVGRTYRRPDLKNKDRIVLVSLGSKQKAYAVPDIMQATGRTVEDTLGDMKIRLQGSPDSRDIQVEPVAGPNAALPSLKRAYMFWFAFDAFYSAAELYRP